MSQTEHEINSHPFITYSNPKFFADILIAYSGLYFLLQGQQTMGQNCNSPALMNY